jgi:hypothetical protein
VDAVRLLVLDCFLVVVVIILLIACLYATSVRLVRLHSQHPRSGNRFASLLDGLPCNKTNCAGSSSYCTVLRSFTEDNFDIKTHALCWIKGKDSKSILTNDTMEFWFQTTMTNDTMGDVFDVELCILYSYRNGTEEPGVSLADCTSIRHSSNFAFGMISPLIHGNYFW